MKQEQLMDKRVLRTQKRLRESMLQLLEEHYDIPARGYQKH